MRKRFEDLTFTDDYMFCEANKELEFGDETRKVVLNASGDLNLVTRELAAFLLYVKDGTVSDALTEKLQQSVDAIKQSEKGRREYMMWELKLRDEYIAGKVEGKAERKAAIQIFKLINQGMTIPEVADSLHMDEDKVICTMNEFDLM